MSNSNENLEWNFLQVFGDNRNTLEEPNEGFY